LVLGLANTLRPTAAAAVYALLAGRRPRRSLAAYLVAGSTFSILVGVLVVGVLHGAHGLERTGTASAIINLVAGAASIGFAVGLLYRPRREAPAPTSARWDPWRQRLADPSLRVAALAGVATHLPGLFYLAGLNAIVGEQQGFGREVAQVLVFNALWYSSALAAFAAFLARPAATLAAVDRFGSWLRSHDRVLGAGLFALVGLYLCVQGLTRLVD
jgi:Sap, sulfolipid-1-addressing protein